MQKNLNYTDNRSDHGCNEKAKVMNSNLGNNKRDNVWQMTLYYDIIYLQDLG